MTLLAIVCVGIVLCICYCISKLSSRWQSDGGVRSQSASSSHYRNRGQEFNIQAHTSQREFHKFIQKIVELFKDQRQLGEYQFAVLILLPSQDINTRNLTLRTRTGVVTRPNEVTDRSSPTFPSEHNFCNFITARPDGPTHAEALLANHFARNYSAQQRPQCQTILLYTWLFPCDYCKREILRIFKFYTRDYRVILVYTSTVKDMDEEEVTKSTRDFEQAGIDVRKEKYDKFLPPA